MLVVINRCLSSHGGFTEHVLEYGRFPGFLHRRQPSLPLSVSRERGLWVVWYNGYE